MTATHFEWDDVKDLQNQRKHGVRFDEAKRAFGDPLRVILRDVVHSAAEERFVCVGQTGGGVLTVRFTFRGGIIRIFGAGYWRKGREHYEEANSLRQ